MKNMNKLIEVVKGMSKKEQHEILNCNIHDSYKNQKETLGDLYELVKEVGFFEFRDEFLKQKNDVYFQMSWLELEPLLETNGFKKVWELNEEKAIFADRSKGLIAYASAYLGEVNTLTIYGQLKGDSSKLPWDFCCNKINDITSFEVSGLASLQNGTGIMTRLEFMEESDLTFLPKWEGKHSYFSNKKGIEEANLQDILHLSNVKISH